MIADIATHPLVLASASPTRMRILAAAGVSVHCDPADVDEAAIKHDCQQRGVPAHEAAIVLAEAKSAVVSARHPTSLVIGADQLMVCGDTWFNKPLSKPAARTMLLSLRGRSHRLISGIAVIRDATTVWRYCDVAELTMRDYSESFVDWYLDQAEDADLQSVGACRLEGPGIQAFARITGDYFTILGLPLLPLLDFLRGQRTLPV